jgi:hypothetical protein
LKLADDKRLALVQRIEEDDDGEEDFDDWDDDGEEASEDAAAASTTAKVSAAATTGTCTGTGADTGADTEVGTGSVNAVVDVDAPSSLTASAADQVADSGASAVSSPIGGGGAVDGASLPPTPPTTAAGAAPQGGRIPQAVQEVRQPQQPDAEKAAAGCSLAESPVIVSDGEGEAVGTAELLVAAVDDTSGSSSGSDEVPVIVSAEDAVIAVAGADESAERNEGWLLTTEDTTDLADVENSKDGDWDDWE